MSASGPSPYEPPPASAPSAKQPPSWWWFVGPVVLLMAAGAVFVVMLVSTLGDVLQVDARVPVNGKPHTVSVPPGERMLFADAGTGEDLPCSITDDEGREIEQRDVVGSFTMTRDGREWSGLTRFDAGDGDIVVTCSQQAAIDGGEVLVTPAHEIGTFVARIFGTILIPMALGLVAVIWAIVLGVLIATRRR